ncbi:hypothetical protein BU16DRAFT_542561 [Lophium mytilinum]|uniref:Uncharacterized protein n=1 Tax=Lophium mytilinum TaxID=390894 RepID=A0A6A6QG99_9PEZI|nr:hypothetical protein BU16DRAFT_542561 [Lophium mytilinum]
MAAAITTALTGQGININSLTTTFTPPPGCDTTFLQCSTCSNAWRAQQCHTILHDWASCWPSAISTITTPTPLNGWGFYSPGLICPVGYITACTNISQTLEGLATTSLLLSTPFKPQFALGVGETAVGCCPTIHINTKYNEYTCASRVGYGGGQTCQSAASTEDPAQYLATICESGTPTATSTTYPLSGVSTMLFAAPLFQLNWNSTDRPGFRFDAPAITTITSQSSSMTSTITAAPTLSTSPQPHSAFPTGAKAGIGQQRKLGVVSTTDVQYAEIPPNGKKNLMPQEMPVLVENGGLLELQAEREPTELPTERILHELGPGTPGG